MEEMNTLQTEGIKCRENKKQCMYITALTLDAVVIHVSLYACNASYSRTDCRFFCQCIWLPAQYVSSYTYIFIFLILAICACSDTYGRRSYIQICHIFINYYFFFTAYTTPTVNCLHEGFHVPGGFWVIVRFTILIM